MQKVITINLNGNAYQIDENGYAALVDYLDGAGRQLQDNPDRLEIVADLEQAIADKCRAFMGPNKSVVTTAEVDQIIKEMGPVEAAGHEAGGASAPAAGADQQQSTRRGPKRLYRIPEEGMWAGVCSGIGAYIGIDPVFVRIAFVLLIIWTAGLGLIGYWILASIIPEASTSDERAAAHGQSPLNARDLVDRAKQQYSDFKGGQDWKGTWRQQRREWRQQRRAMRRQWRATRWQQRWGGWGSGWGAGWGAPPPSYAPGPYGTRMLSGLMVPLFSIAGALCFWFFIWAVFSLVRSGQVLGEPLPDEMPLWAGILILVCVYHAIAWPLHFARRRAAYYSFGGAHRGAMAAWDGVMSLAFGILVAWLAYQYLPEVREIIRSLPDVWNSFRFEDLRS